VSCRGLDADDLTPGPCSRRVSSGASLMLNAIMMLRV
jgi:hypothetical protein